MKVVPSKNQMHISCSFLKKTDSYTTQGLSFDSLNPSCFVFSICFKDHRPDHYSFINKELLFFYKNVAQILN